MKGDFSRITFDPTKHFTSVLMQQGRVQLDADWNEQAAILLWQIRTLARGLIGEFGGEAGSFQISAAANDANQLQAATGLYFVHGIAVENKALAKVPMPVQQKPVNVTNIGRLEAGAAPGSTAPPSHTVSYDVFLAVWERLVTWLDDPSIREIALGDGIDTTVRTQVKWSIVVSPAKTDATGQTGDFELPLLHVGLDGGVKSSSICNISPDSRYRGAGNQLYRVEIHNTWNSKDGASFKWSRENASLVFPVKKVDGTKLYLSTIGRDDRLSIHPGDYLEFESNDIPWDEALPLAHVQSVSADDSSVTVDKVPDSFKVSTGNLAAVRRWDHSQENSSGLTKVTEGKPISIESGLNITFQTSAALACRRGDYWLIPARTGVMWAPPSGTLPAIRPECFLAPLASFSLDALGTVSNLLDQRSIIQLAAKHV